MNILKQPKDTELKALPAM